MADSTSRSGSSTAVVAVIAILAILALVWFFVIQKGVVPTAGGDSSPDINVEVNPGGATTAE